MEKMEKNDIFLEKEFYREKIMEMVEKIDNPEYLFKIYHYMLAKYRRDQKI